VRKKNMQQKMLELMGGKKIKKKVEFNHYESFKELHQDIMSFDLDPSLNVRQAICLI